MVWILYTFYLLFYDLEGITVICDDCFCKRHILLLDFQFIESEELGDKAILDWLQLS